jgi:hypothetical protein
MTGTRDVAGLLVRLAPSAGVQAIRKLFAVDLMVAFEEAIQHLDLNGGVDGEAHALPRLVESVIERQIGPAACLGYCVVNLDVYLS